LRLNSCDRGVELGFLSLVANQRHRQQVVIYKSGFHALILVELQQEGKEMVLPATRASRPGSGCHQPRLKAL